MTPPMRKKEIRRNPVAEWVMAAAQFLEKYRTGVLIGLAVLVLVAGAGGGYWWHRDQQASAANLALAQAMDPLQGPKASTPADMDAALQKLQAVAQTYPGTESGQEALIRLGNLQYQAGKLDQAGATFGEYLTRYPSGRFMMMAALGKAYVEESKGELQGAVATLSTALDRDKNSSLAGEAYTSQGRLYEHLKKPEDARRIYGLMVERFPGTYWQQHALQRLNALGTK